jgi:threonine dehydrogenase-like Zn-dependent dehydrogenase
VFALGRKDPTSIEPTMLRKIGAQYVDDRELKLNKLSEELGHMDLILDATGAARLEFNLISVLAMNGLYVLTGIPGGDRSLDIQGAALLRELVLRNQVVVGSVNASQKHFQMAIQDLRKSKERWGDAIDQLITHRFPYPKFAEAIITRPPDEIKAIVEWRKINEAQNG